jgi:rhodanese-related sulfurtransferase
VEYDVVRVCQSFLGWLVFALAMIPAVAWPANPEEGIFDLQDLRVKITPSVPYVVTRHKGEEVRVMRHQDPAHTIEAPYARTSRDCPPFCVQPMRLASGVETIGELELLGYLERIGRGEEGVLVIDSRTADWTAQGTIPGAINIPFTSLHAQHASAKAIGELLELELGVVRDGGLWNFSAAKTLVFFCNGPWCGQSPTNIRALLDLGYPPSKLKWYRGGLQVWEQLGFTTVKP